MKRGERTHAWAILLMLLATLLNSAAQLLYKHAIDQQGLDIIALISQGTVILGLLSYATSGVCLLAALRGGQASVLYPVYTLSFIWISIGAHLLFGEAITTTAAAGMTGIIAGIILINQQPGGEAA
ncbi:hypothetical protein JXA12_01835 [Candidatus Woesearchaeota archaeon]|nr:hypothetical protein [Candidatus Woesearchaeota archaeon]